MKLEIDWLASHNGSSRQYGCRRIRITSMIQ